MKKISKIILGVMVLTAFTSCKTQFAITSGGENLTALTQVTDMEAPCTNPFGGDDGKNLYFSSCSDKKYWNIFKKDNVLASTMAQRTSGNNYNIQPAYNKATDRVAFKCQSEGAMSSDIYLVNGTKGQTLSPITESGDAYEGHPSFNAAGDIVLYDKVSYTYYRKNSTLDLFYGKTTGILTIVKNSEIWMKNLKTGETTLLGNGAEPCFAPNGKTFVFTRYASNAKSCSIWMMDIDGNNPVQLTDAKKGFAHNPRWSPDGKKIVFQTYKKDKNDYDLYIVNTDGEGLTQLTTNKSWDGEPYWSTDGYIYFTSNRGNEKSNYQIWRFKVE